MKAVLIGTMLASIGCAAVPPEGVPPEADASGYRCHPNGLPDLVGREPTQALGEEALRRSGSRTLRWIRPGDAVTMDYSPSRLNIRLDARHRVEGFSCG